MSIDFFSLQRDDTLPAIPVSINGDEARAYLDATGEPAERWEGAVPPLALGAFVLAGLMERMPLPAGALHAGQDFDFLRAVTPGEPLEAAIRVAQRSERRGTVILVLEFKLTGSGSTALRGRSTVIAPLEAAQS